MQTLLNDFDLIREDLERTSVGSGNSQLKAKKILDIVSYKSFGATLAEFTDMFSVSERMLEAFQKQHGLLLEIGDTVREGLKKFEALGNDIGKNLRTFLQKVMPRRLYRGKLKRSNLSQYDFCDVAYYRSVIPASEESDESSEASIEDSNEEETEADRTESVPVSSNKLVALEKNGPNAVPHSSWRRLLYERIVAEIKKLFDVEQLESFDLFDPQNFVFACPETVSSPKCNVLERCYKAFRQIHAHDAPEGAVQKWNRVCEFYGIAASLCSTRLEQWKALLSSITGSEKYEGLTVERPTSGFWSYALADTSLPWTTELLEIVRKVMVTGQSSASAERTFSIMSRLKSSDRSSLGDDTLDDLIRLRFNGPERIDDDSMYEYTLQFLQRHKRVDQDEYWRRRPKQVLYNVVAYLAYWLEFC